jgi:glutaminase
MITGAKADAVWEKIIGTYDDYAGRPLTVLQDVYKSESDSNQRNRTGACRDRPPASNRS